MSFAQWHYSLAGQHILRIAPPRITPDRGAKKLSDTELTAALHKAIASERSNIAASIACTCQIFP